MQLWGSRYDTWDEYRKDWKKNRKRAFGETFRFILVWLLTFILPILVGILVQNFIGRTSPSTEITSSAATTTANNSGFTLSGTTITGFGTGVVDNGVSVDLSGATIEHNNIGIQVNNNTVTNSTPLELQVTGVKVRFFSSTTTDGLYNGNFEIHYFALDNVVSETDLVPHWPLTQCSKYNTVGTDDGAVSSMEIDALCKAFATVTSTQELFTTSISK